MSWSTGELPGVNQSKEYCNLGTTEGFKGVWHKPYGGIDNDCSCL